VISQKKHNIYHLFDFNCFTYYFAYMIRIITRGDIEPFHFLINKNRNRINTYFPMTVFHTNAISNTRSFVEEKIREARNMEFLLLMLHDERGSLIGMAQIKNFDRFVKKCEVSYFIDREFEGKGWATKAIREVIQYVFSKMDMEKIYCRIDPENKASIRVAEKCGFQLEGRLKKEFKTGDGDIIDVLYYGVFKEKYAL